MVSKFGKTKDDLDEVYELIDVEELDKESSMLYLLCGKDNKEQDFYAYMAIRPSLYREFITKQATQETLIPTDYGVVLESGFGELPPEKLQKEMHEEYGFDSQFEKNIYKMMERKAEELQNVK